jgi:hypothetical protein
MIRRFWERLLDLHPPTMVIFTVAFMAFCIAFGPRRPSCTACQCQSCSELRMAVTAQLKESTP